MGVRGLTTFIANRSHQYHEDYELCNTCLVLDGNSIACQLYKWHCKCNDCFGGDYDKFANVINKFFNLLRECNITPLVVFDGGYEKRKLRTVMSRMRDKLKNARDINSANEGSISLFPLFLRELFVDIAQKLNVKCVRCDFEGDSEIACLARSLNCPVLSYDSDFYIFDVLYIPFSTMDLRVRRKKDQNYIPCEVYRVDKFLKGFGGLNKINLPLLGVLLGNDYVKKRSFVPFYRHIKFQKSKHKNEQQRLIKTLIVWLRNETPKSALVKILSRFKMKNRKKIADKIQTAIKGYQCLDSPILAQFDAKSPKPIEEFRLLKPEEIEAIPEDDSEEIPIEENSSDEETDLENAEVEEDDAEVEEDDAEVEVDDTEIAVPSPFQQNFRNCRYPSSFMDLLVSHTYYTIPQVEDFTLEHSHKISVQIIAAIHRILTNSEKFTIVARTDGHAHVKRYRYSKCDTEVPSLLEIQSLDVNKRKSLMLEILKLSDEKLDLFPASWHLVLLSVKYWVTNTKRSISMPHIYSLLLCGVVLNYIDDKVGFYRSTKSFLAKYGSANSENPTTINAQFDIAKSLEQINLGDSVSCLRKLIHYFQMDGKMRVNGRLFDKIVVHEFAELQSCLLHVKYLNNLFDNPYTNFVISDFYDGTFLYNMTSNLKKRSDVRAYLGILLQDCPAVFNTVELMASQLEEILRGSMDATVPPRRRKRKKKVVKTTCAMEERTALSDTDGDYDLDVNNKYSMLSFIDR